MLWIQSELKIKIISDLFQADKIIFSDKEIEKFDELAVKWKSGSISMKELILELRGGDLAEWGAKFGIAMAIITVLNNVDAFQVPPAPGAIVPPHLQWLYGNQQPGNHFGYGKEAGPRSITIVGATQNVGSNKKELPSGSWKYIDVMRELYKQSSKKRVEIEIQIADQIYTIKNRYSLNADELGDKLAEKVYDSIRESDTYICDIAANLGFKADNIKNVKDHVFYNKHYLDRFAPAKPVEDRRFDPNIQQALAWKRLEAGIHTQDAITWIKHEFAERPHELKYGSGYLEAHDRAQSRFYDAPWEDKF